MPMKHFYKILLIIFLLSFHGELAAQSKESKKVLFVGNSYTYFWNLPQTVEAMCNEKGLTYTCDQSTAGGANLGQHWRSAKGLHTLKKLDAKTYDFVVIQDHSMRAIKDPDSLHIYGEKFANLIKNKHGEILLYMTWSRKWDPFMIDQIAKQYRLLGESIGATVVPVGEAWKLSNELRPSLDLYDVDQTHPSPEGTYLNACMFYGMMTGESPVGLPHRVTAKDAKGEKLYLNIQSKENALFLQKVAAHSLGELIKSTVK